jgi:hypothetical protein
LRHLDWSLTSIGNSDLHFLSETPHIQFLLLAQTNIDDDGVALIADYCKELRKLLLTLTNVTDECFVYICAMTSLKELGVSGAYRREIPQQTATATLISHLLTLYCDSYSGRYIGDRWRNSGFVDGSARPACISILLGTCSNIKLL